MLAEAERKLLWFAEKTQFLKDHRNTARYRVVPNHFERPERKLLTHHIPGWVRPGSLYFLTLCCEPRGCNQLCHAAVAPAILESIGYYHSAAKWYMRLALLMPDHLHALAAFPSTEQMSAVIGAWKGYATRNLGISWQRGFFDHRLRDREALQEKARYIRQNPVRAGLIEKPEEWPYKYEADRG